MICGIQPGYLPWLGYFDQMMRVDAFLIADELDYSSSGWTHRNRVKGPEGAHWLNLPGYPKSGQRINEVELNQSTPWARKHLTTLRHFYRGCPGATETIGELAEILDPKAKRLVDVSIPTIRFLAKKLGITVPILLSSELQLEAHYHDRFPAKPGPTHRIISYLEALEATELLEGDSGRSYFDLALFEEHGMRVVFHDYQHPQYHQPHGAFQSHLSTIDLLLSVGGNEARRVMNEGLKS